MDETILEGRVDAQAYSVIYPVAFAVQFLLASICLILLIITGNYWFILLHLIFLFTTGRYILMFKQSLMMLHKLRGYYGR